MAIYSQTLGVKIVRKKHCVSFTGSDTAGGLVRALMSVPDWAVVDDVDTNDEDVTTITFHDERRLHDE